MYICVTVDVFVQMSHEIATAVIERKVITRYLEEIVTCFLTTKEKRRQ